MKVRYFSAETTELDDFGVKLGDVVYDGRTKMGPWAMMSQASFKKYGVGLGTGKGQKYRRNEEGHFIKEEG